MGFKIEQGRREINGAGGLTLVGGVLGRLGRFEETGWHGFRENQARVDKPPVDSQVRAWPLLPGAVGLLRT